MKKRIAILGSTGSIGTQTLEVMAAYPEHFEVETLTAYSNVDLLVQQAIRFQPNNVVIGNKELYSRLKDALAAYPFKVYAGNDAIAQAVSLPSVDMAVIATVGFSGLIPTVKAIEAGKHIALANKETLVVAGDLICELSARHNSAILPVDSEHSAIFQCLAGEISPIEKLILTASGGPFRGKDRSFLEKVTPACALKHPNWTMGAKITIDSASLMNKGFEVIEAQWLFGVQPQQIEVVIHPQSFIHSMVQFEDGSVKAQIGLPDMKLPIQYAFAYPERIRNKSPRMDFFNCGSFTFEKPDTSVFRNLQLAYEAMHKGGNMPCILNAANEVVVAAFRQERVGFLRMSDIIEKTMSSVPYIAHPTYEEYVETDKEARALATIMIE